ncbi:MAG: hypothetical protein ACI4Q3_02545 [Kiritimatiellia bacterium]
MKKILPEQVLPTPACFRQRVNLPAAQVADLSADELAAALAFEIEPFSGISRFDGSMAWKLVGGVETSRRVYDVVQIRKSDLVRAVQEGRKAGRPVRAVTAVPESAAGETLDMLPWIDARGGGGPGVGGRQVLIAVLVVLLFGGLAWDAWSLAARERELAGEVGVRRGLQAEKDRLSQKLANVRQDTQRVRTARLAHARIQQNVDTLRVAWQMLLAAIPAACQDDAVVKSVKATGAFAAELSGVALSADAAGRVCVRLAEALKAPKSAWHVRPVRVGAAASGGTAAFVCQLEFDPEGQFR